ncbi:cytochrome P450 4V2-like [Pectinophora gossypiella]|uniref:cytochrome P450 4V2-like n=1 Tax=Pectinophora gossypiella TaxID=13191 RepID=UPI00214E3D12|nr:cytochrome P450 4V2-like [Pectinophora gossypiella]
MKVYSHDIPSLPLVGIAYLAIGSSEKRMKFIQTVGHETNKKGGIIAEWFGPTPYLVVSDAEIAGLLSKSCLEKDDLFRKMIGYLVGNGNIVAKVSEWRTRRRILVPTFNTKNLNKFVHIFSKQGEIMVDHLRNKADAQPFSVWSYFAANNMDSVCESVMGVQLKAQEHSKHPFLWAFAEAFYFTANRMFQPWLYNDAIYRLLPSYRKHKIARDTMFDFVGDMIVSKRKEIKNCHNKNMHIDEQPMKTFLEMLIESSEEEGGYTNEELTDETMVLMLASTDTSANAAAFAMIMLSRHPEVQEKVFEELKEIFGESKRPVVPEDLPRLKYLDVVLKETLRIFPPVPTILRKVTSDFALPSGVTIPEGYGILINIWGIHHNSTYWGEDVEDFRPERFLDTPFKHPAQFMPFSFGPRNCPGYQYALMSMKTLLATTLREYRVLPATSPDEANRYPPLRLCHELMLRDADEWRVCLEPRRKNNL